MRKAEALYKKYLKGLTQGAKTEYMLGDYDEEWKYYLPNKDRFENALKLLKKEIRKRGEGLSMLDIGTSPFTFMMSLRYPKMNLSTVDYTRGFEKRAGDMGIKFRRVDLNNKNSRLGKGKHDVVMFLEVLEHLKGDHDLVLRKVADSLKTGGVCVLQTPNKLSPKKLVMEGFLGWFWKLLSKTPEQSEEFIHYREYSLSELVDSIENMSGVKVKTAWHDLYYDTPGSALVYRKNQGVIRGLLEINYFMAKVLAPWRRGMVVIFEKL